MDHGYLLTLCIHLTEIPTSPQNFGNTVGQNPAPILTLCHRLREGVQKKVFLGDFSQMWVGGVAFFDPNFTFRSPKSHKNPGVGG